MSTTGINDLQDQIRKSWSEIFMDELHESYILQNLVSKEYEGEIEKGGDEVTITQFDTPQSDLRTIGTNADTFDPNKLTTQKMTLKADKRAVSSHKFSDITEIQTIVDPANNPKVRQGMMRDIGRQINTYLYSLLVASASNPDHQINGQATMTEALLAAMRTKTSEAYWPVEERKYCLAGPQYYSDLLADDGLQSSDYGAADAARIAGRMSTQRYGFTIFEDNSRALSTSLDSFTSDAILYAAQTVPQIKISDLHSNEQFGFVMSIDLIFGAKQSIDGGKKCYNITSAS